MSAPTVFATVTDKNIIVHLPYYDPWLTRHMRTIPSAGFHKDHPVYGTHWRFPLEWRTATLISQTFGHRVEYSPEMRAWGLAQRKLAVELQAIAKQLETDDLIHLPTLLPDLAAKLRPYQAVGAKFVARCPNPLIADHPGLGKTFEIIAGVYEAQVHTGPKLVVCPVSAVEDVWIRHLDSLQPQPAFMCMGDRRQRETVLEDIEACVDAEMDFWLVVNPAMVQYRNTNDFDPETGEQIVASTYPILHEIDWNVVIFDECHKGLQNPSTLTGKAMFNLPSKKRIATSGTPAGGRPLKYWGVLHWLEPKEFKSKNRWAEQWLTISEKEHYVRGGRGEKAVTRDFNGDIRPGMEEEFYKAHSRFMIRRTKDEVAPEMPPKQQEDRWAEMTGAQAAQYRAMAEDAEVKISETEAISATSILAEYTRLKQFANALCTLGEPDRSGRVPVLPTTTSCKLPIVEELLEERGVFDNNLPDAKAIIFSQFSSMVDMVHDWLAAKGAPVSKITGAVRPQDRGGIIDDFQREDGGAKVICVTTTAGGTAITLDRADTVIFLDETWVPDDQEQAEDRAHRISRIHNVNVFYIRTKGTIEETIMKKVGKKADVNKIILDLHRTGFRATHGDAT